MNAFVNGLAKGLYEIWADDEDWILPAWEELPEAEKNGWRRVAEVVLKAHK